MKGVRGQAPSLGELHQRAGRGDLLCDSGYLQVCQRVLRPTGLSTAALREQWDAYVDQLKQDGPGAPDGDLSGGSGRILITQADKRYSFRLKSSLCGAWRLIRLQALPLLSGRLESVAWQDRRILGGVLYNGERRVFVWAVWALAGSPRSAPARNCQKPRFGAGGRVYLKPERMAYAREAYGIAEDHCFADYHQLINCPDVDVVDISTSNNAHFEVAKAAIEAGKPYCLEKPVTLPRRRPISWPR